MEMERYTKHIDAQLDAAFEGAEWFGNIRLNDDYLFHRRILSWRYIAFTNIVRAWRRVEECSSRTGCCSNDFSMHYLMIETADGGTLSLKIGEALYRHEPELLIEKLGKKHPNIKIGIPERKNKETV